MSDNVKMFIAIFMLIGMTVGISFVFGVHTGVSGVVGSDRNKAIREMKKECEKDLARNLKCEMVYVKPKESE